VESVARPAKRRGGRSAGVGLSEGERGGGVGAVAGGANADPGAGLGSGELCGNVTGGGHLDAAEEGPRVVAGAVHFESEGDSLGGVVGEVEQAVIEARKVEGVGGGVGCDGLVEPNRAAADGRAEAVELGGLG